MMRRSNHPLQKRRSPKTRVPVTVRLPEALVDKIDADLDHRDVPLSRNNWFLEAAIEKLRKGSAGASNGSK